MGTTVFRLLDGTKAYVQAIIDNYSRRILAWRISGKLEPAATAALLVKAEKASRRETLKLNQATTLMVDSGVENFNEAVDQLVSGGALERIVAQTDIRFSNSLIESFWRALKHNWCFQHQLDGLETLEMLVASISTSTIACSRTPPLTARHLTRCTSRPARRSQDSLKKSELAPRLLGSRPTVPQRVRSVRRSDIVAGIIWKSSRANGYARASTGSRGLLPGVATKGVQPWPRVNR